MNKKRVVIICPGRGSYTRETSSYLENSLSYLTEYLSDFDKKRLELKLQSISELDQEPFRAKTHMVGLNASPLIYACSLSDYLFINKDKFEIVAVCGNSMGWYTALALGGALTIQNGYDLIQTMGNLTQHKGDGGQIIYPIINDEWMIDDEKKKYLFSEIKKYNLHISIYLGGYVVIGGAQESLNKILKSLPKEDKYPFQIPYHSAFHTPLLNSITQLAMDGVGREIFNKPSLPLIDGDGVIWSPWSSSLSELYRYTLNHQVINTYNFSSSVNVAIKEFCPDHLILLGPGNSLGGPVAQALIEQKWNNLKSKADFIDSQQEDPFVLSMGIMDQKQLLK